MDAMAIFEQFDRLVDNSVCLGMTVRSGIAMCRHDLESARVFTLDRRTFIRYNVVMSSGVRFVVSCRFGLNSAEHSLRGSEEALVEARLRGII